MQRELEMTMLKILLALSCAALLLAASARVESRPRHATKKTKTSDAKDRTKPGEPLPTKDENATDTSIDSKQAAVPQSSPDPKWKYSVTPYVFLPRLTGDVGVVGQTAQVNASFRDIFRNLNFAAMGTFEARKGNWSIIGDAMYMSLSGQKVTPSPLFSDIDVEVKEIVLEPAVAYRVLKAERGSIDLLGGVRVWHVKSHVTFQPRILPLFDEERSKTWVDPIIGARGIVTLSPRVFVNARFDVGGMGINSDFTGQVYGGAGFQLKPRVALLGGYRYLRVDYANEGFIFKTALSGIVLGAKFDF